MGLLSQTADRVRQFWRKDTSQQNSENVTKIWMRKPFEKDITEDIKVNGELTRGLFNNAYPGFKASGALAYAPIAVPVSFMGPPIPKPVEQNDAAQEMLTKIAEEKIGQCYEIERASHRDGTIWVWPYYSSRTNKLYWELILDDSVTDIIKDVDTGEPIEIITDELITYRMDENLTSTVHRKRRFTREFITDTYSSKVPTVNGEFDKTLKQRRGRNTLGILPIPFSNLAEAGHIRGRSDLERIIPNIKLHNDVLTQWSTILSKFKPKLVQSTTNLDKWMTNNGADASTFDPQKADFVVNDSSKEEKTDYIFLQGVGQEYQMNLNTQYWLAVQGSAIPEIVWGLVSTGNHASSEEQMASLMQYVYGKQIQATKAFEKLFSASLQLVAMAEMGQAVDVSVEWNELSTLSPTAKAEVLRNFSTGISTLVNAGAPTETIHKFFVDFYPEATEEEIETFKSQVSEASARLAFLKASYTEQQEAGGTDGLDDLISRRG